jgi:hypothetical protein
MATVDKNHGPVSAAAHNGHANNHAGAAPSIRRPKRARAASEPALDRLAALGRDLPRWLQAQLKSNPLAVVATFGAGTFVLGALLGSKLGRVTLAAAIPYAVERVFEGAMGETLRDYVGGLVRSGEREVETPS